MSMPAYEAKRMKEAYQLQSQLVAKAQWCLTCNRMKPICVCKKTTPDAHLGGVRC